MKKVNIYILILMLASMLSCKIDRVGKGKIYSQYKSEENIEKSVSYSKLEIYKKLAKSVASEIGRNDIDVIAGEIENRNIIDFSDTNKVKLITKQSGNNYTTEIEINDSTLFSNTVNMLSSIKQEGKIFQNTFRAKAITKLDRNIELSPYVRAGIERNTLNKARESLYDIMMSNNIDINKAAVATNNAYVVEEMYDNTQYTIVIESDIE